MVKKVLKKVKPSKGFAHLMHIVLVMIVPILAYMLIRLDVALAAVVLVILSKWRMFAVQPRHWLAHMRTNAVDLIVSLSVVGFMVMSRDSFATCLIWLAVFEIWMLFIKPGESVFRVTMQSLIALALGVTAVFLVFESAPLTVYILLVSIVSYFSARHFFGSFDEPYALSYSWLWTFFSACMVWVLGHWLLFYRGVPQISLLLTVIGYTLGVLYYLNEQERLSVLVRRQIIFVALALVFIIIIFANWGEGIVK